MSCSSRRRQVGLEPVVILLRDRLELVVVAAGAADRQAEERGADDVGPLGEHFVAAERDLGVPGVAPDRAEPVEDRRGLAARGRPGAISSPASCSVRKRSNGLSRLNESIT